MGMEIVHPKVRALVSKLLVLSSLSKVTSVLTLRNGVVIFSR